MRAHHLGLRKEEADPNANYPERPADVPVSQVVDMKRQGLSDNQIIQNLNRMGYESHKIFDALNQAATVGGVSKISPDEFQQGYPYPQPQQTPQQGFQQQPAPQEIPVEQPLSSSNEELIEAIIDEKWNDLMRDINRIIEWKNKTEARINQLVQEMTDLKHSFDKLHSALIAKIGEYDKNILNVGTEIKAMEKVFEKVLPAFTQNVNELSRIAASMKKKK
ncbi:hypothetical protein D6745_02790 [Candidatus Woesearchaeota archaeon]|nr:MAG: hypothetical protein D6745_02790 [Candidatus Woesearchaeota archaeon]